MSKITELITLRKRIYSFVAATLSGLIFIASRILTALYATRVAESIQNNFPDLKEQYQLMLTKLIEYTSLIADYIGWVILVAGVLILLNKTFIAKILIYVTVGSGMVAFAIPVFAAIPEGWLAVQIAIESLATKYVLASCLAIMAFLYAK